MALKHIIKDTKQVVQWKRINRKQSTRWQQLSRLKATAFFCLQTNLVSCMKHNNLYLGLVTPSSGWWSPIDLLGLRPSMIAEVGWHHLLVEIASETNSDCFCWTCGNAPLIASWSIVLIFEISTRLNSPTS